jgi:hypothetical protein
MTSRIISSNSLMSYWNGTITGTSPIANEERRSRMKRLKVSPYWIANRLLLDLISDYCPTSYNPLRNS